MEISLISVYIFGGFGDDFVNWFTTFCSVSSGRVLNNGYSCQGCPLRTCSLYTLKFWHGALPQES